MFLFNVSQKMINIYKFKFDKEIPAISDNSFPLWNWYVKPLTVNRKKYVLFLERETYLCVWAVGITSKNITEIFKEHLKEVLYIAGIPQEKIKTLDIDNRQSYISKTSDKVWIGVSNEVTRLSKYPISEIKQTASGLHPLLLYKPNTYLYGMPNYKTPENEIRKLFGLERKNEK